MRPIDLMWKTTYWPPWSLTGNPDADPLFINYSISYTIEYSKSLEETFVDNKELEISSEWIMAAQYVFIRATFLCILCIIQDLN